MGTHLLVGLFQYYVTALIAFGILPPQEIVAHVLPIESIIETGVIAIFAKIFIFNKKCIDVQWENYTLALIKNYAHFNCFNAAQKFSQINKNYAPQDSEVYKRSMKIFVSCP